MGFLMSYNQELLSQKDDANAQTILIVTDDVALGQMLAFVLLQETPYHPYLVDNEDAALRAVQEVTPVLFILDDHVSGLTGLELYEQLHRKKGLATVPAIVLSADVPRTERESHHMLCLTKPFTLDDLLIALAVILTHTPFQKTSPQYQRR